MTKLDARVRSGAEAAAAAGVPVLVTVPRLLDARGIERERKRTQWTLAVAGTTGALFVVAVMLRLKGLL